MHKIFLDNYNTIYSVKWEHKGHEVHKNPDEGPRYLVFKPGAERASWEVYSLRAAQELIESV